MVNTSLFRLHPNLAPSFITIKNAFGILASRWRILRKPIIAERVVQAVVAFHNYLIDTKCNKYCTHTLVDWEDQDGNFHHGEWRQNETTNLLPCGRVSTNTYKQYVEEMRENLSLYFYGEGAVPFQWDK
ncbi:hypothetical protein JTB14_000033 [Gonioctena quinquepunctata]|nr:hypothetical protein JTB14_000033 [Gonioctena quinquepunctata]